MPEEGENFTCTYCEKEFDSKRGLHIHQSQVHPEEDKQKIDAKKDTEESNNSQEKDSSQSSDNEDSNIFSDDTDIDVKETEEEFSVDIGNDQDSTFQMSLTTRQVAAASLVVGLITGGLGAAAYLL
ncbi:MAG: hypothetical protein ACI977_000119 [Candidatus Nanohaloarchaea archaeon]|jgi:hypothetical protein